MQSREQCAALVSVVEAMEEGICVFDARGHVAYRNGVLRTLLTAERDRHRLQMAIDDIHRALVPALADSDGRKDATTPSGTVRIAVRTTAAEYRLRACVVAPQSTGTRAIVVYLHPRRAKHWIPSELRARYRLTPTESRVASMLEGGLRSREIAAALAISVHTARRHSEAVLRKLRVNSRSLVRSKLSRE
jgi:DNA-binding CsgD family transcriptional regulator